MMFTEANSYRAVLAGSLTAITETNGTRWDFWDV